MKCINGKCKNEAKYIIERQWLDMGTEGRCEKCSKYLPWLKGMKKGDFSPPVYNFVFKETKSWYRLVDIVES